jgi:hypothetical protein
LTAATVLQQARAAAVELSATPDGKLRWRSRGPLPERLGERLAEQKAELLELLADEAFTLAALEAHWGLPSGSLALYTPERFRQAFPEGPERLPGRWHPREAT